MASLSSRRFAQKGGVSVSLNLQPLNKHQIRTQCHTLPPLMLIMAFGTVAFETFLFRKKLAENEGHKYEIYYWPNGTTVFLKRPNQSGALNEDDKEAIYKQFAENSTELCMEITYART